MKENSDIEEGALPDFTLEDIALMIGACVAVWGDGDLSREEHELLLEFIKKSEPEIFERGWVEHRDARDLELCRLEYMVWLLEHINGLKESMLNGKNDQKAQKMAIVELCGMYRNKMVSHNAEMGAERASSLGPIDAAKYAVNYVQENKRHLFTFLENVSQADSEVSPNEVALILKVKAELSPPWERLRESANRLNTKGKVLFWLLIFSLVGITSCWLPWRLEECRKKNGQSLKVLNSKGLVAVIALIFLTFCFVDYLLFLWYFTWIPLVTSWTSKIVILRSVK